MDINAHYEHESVDGELTPYSNNALIKRPYNINTDDNTQRSGDSTMKDSFLAQSNVMENPPPMSANDHGIFSSEIDHTPITRTSNQTEIKKQKKKKITTPYAANQTFT